MSNSDEGGWLSRLRQGLGRTSAKLTGGIGELLSKRRLDQEALNELEELLIASDLGPATAAGLKESLAKKRLDKDVTADEVKALLADDISIMLKKVAQPLVVDQTKKPFVVLVCGVNGSGKTTTIAKLANHWRQQGLSVMMAAGDTFRAAAIEQLQIWGGRTGCPVVASEIGADAAGLVFDAHARAKAEGMDVLLVDTAGRLQNKKDLMAELEKIVRVIGKADETAPHAVLLVMDATIGQNAHVQVETFKEMINVTGLIVTKLDGSARGGVVVALAEKFVLPVHAVGVGEGLDDMQPFDSHIFARSLMGLRS